MGANNYNISIVMATYNGANFLVEQLESLANQTILPNEIIISDDNSSDCTVDLVKRFQKTSSIEIKININKENLGYSGNFNKALSLSSGDLVFLSDQDDVWFPNKIEYMLNVVDKNPSYLMYMNNAILTNSKLKPSEFTTYGQIKIAGFNDESYIMGCCALVKRELLEFALPIPVELNAHDVFLGTISDGLKAKYISSEILQYYRRHDSNTSDSPINKLKTLYKSDINFKGFKDVIFHKKYNIDETLLKLKISLNHLELIKSRLDKLSDLYVLRYEDFLIQYNAKVSLYQKRKDLRNMSFIKRIFNGFKFYKYVYPKNSRFRNLIRDIIGI